MQKYMLCIHKAKIKDTNYKKNSNWNWQTPRWRNEEIYIQSRMSQQRNLPCIACIPSNWKYTFFHFQLQYTRLNKKKMHPIVFTTWTHHYEKKKEDSILISEDLII